MTQDSFVASAALVLWIPFAIGLFFVLRPERAALVTIFGGLLFLPELTWFKFPLLPPLGKQTIPYFAALIGFTLRAPKRVWRLPRERWVTLVTLGFIADGIGIALTNGDPLIYGIWRKIDLPGLTIKDGMYVALSSIFRVAIPFFMGGVLVRDLKDLEDLFRFVVKVGLIYAFLALLEVRLSPQLHNWVYGYHQHDFQQVLRFGGYRPTVFLAHGLAVGLFFAVCVLSATMLTRQAPRKIWGMSAKTAALIFAAVLILCKSTGAIVYGAICAPLMLLGSAKVQQRVATGIALIVLLYPSMRESDVFPTAAVLSLAEVAGQDRADSVAFRFRNEDLLLKKARQRPWFGWGEYGRNEVYDDAGRPTTTTDGEWIIALGIAGFTGFLTWFGLLIIPLFLTARRIRRAGDRAERRLLAATSLIVAVTALDLLPNSLYSNYPFLLSGALLSASASLAGSRWRGHQILVADADFVDPLYEQSAAAVGADGR
jgi:O-antigen ligase